MAFASMLRRSASSVVPLAIRSVRNQRYHHCSALYSAVERRNLPRQLSRSSFPSVLHYSSTPTRPSSDESLVRVIESEIKMADESGDPGQVEQLPGGFPFKIQDNPGHQTITLTREFQDETINVEVQMPNLVTGEDDDGDDNDNDAEKSNQSSVPLVVTVSKKSGPSLEFSVTAFPDEISIDSLSVKNPENSEEQIAYEGPDFSDLDENLQKAFHKYLEIRGIKPSTTNFLHEYMINKENKEYKMWLKNLKNFVEA